MAENTKDKPGKTALVVSSSSSIDYTNMELPDFVFVLRSILYLNNRIYRDVVDFNYEDYLAWMRTHPTDKQITEGARENDAAELMIKLSDMGFTEALVITPSRALATTYNNVKEIADLMSHRIKVHVFDTGTFTASELPFIFLAARLMKQGKTIPEIVSALAVMHSNTELYVFPNDIKHIIRQGRVSRIKGLIASLMDIKTILSIRYGEVSVAATIRQTKNAMSYYSNLVNEMFDGGNTLGVGMFSGDSSFNSRMKSHINQNNIKMTVHVTPVILAHFGVDSVATAIYKNTDAYLDPDFSLSFA